VTTDSPVGGSFRGRVISRGESPASIANIANIITVARIALTPVFLVGVLIDDGQHGLWRWAAALLFILAIATDGVDGALARSRNLVTALGVLLDPIADKVLVGGALMALAWVGELPWWVVVLILGREVAITVFRLVRLRDRVIPASRGGKLKTVVQSVAVSSWLLPTWVFAGSWVFVVNDVLMGAVVVITIWTGIDYLIKGAKAPRES
jgi:CDP-diacylglycerol--glycerol-3-phosphate 3-phosphatidyltransferase